MSKSGKKEKPNTNTQKDSQVVQNLNFMEIQSDSGSKSVGS
jgi:hypothetical protein